MIYLDDEGYPTEEYLQYIRDYTPDIMPPDRFFEEVIFEGWEHRACRITRKYKGCRKVELHTIGWSGNEEIIHEVMKNLHLWRYWYKTERGGHYYFKIPIKEIK